MPLSFDNFANCGDGGRGAYENGDKANPNHRNDGWNTSSRGNGNASPGGSGGAFGTALNDKLAALVGTNKNSNRSSGDGPNKQGWNNAPPGSPLATNGNASFGGPPKGHAPYPSAMGAQNNSNWNGQPAAGSNQGGINGGRINTWLSKTPMGASVNGHKPWKGAVSVKTGWGSNFGGNMGNNNNSGDNGGRGQTNNISNGGWNGSTKDNGNWGGTQKGGVKSQHGEWNNDNGDGGWNESGGNGQGWNEGNQTKDWNSGNGSGNGGGGWSNGGNANGKGGYQTDNWNGGNGNGNGGGDWNGISNGNQQAAPKSGW